MNYDAIDDFLRRARKLNKSNKDMRLSYDEAQQLAINIGELMSQLHQKRPKQAVAAPPSAIDGGAFPKAP